MVAGVSVASVAVPQALAFAVLAGLPPARGLYAAGLPLVAAAPLASSPYLQTGPTAVTSLLTFGALGALAPPGSRDYAALAALLALVVGALRLAVGLAKGGAVAYLLSQPVLAGFTPAAAVLIVAGQVPAAAGVAPSTGNVWGQALDALARPGSWEPTSAVLFFATVAAVLGSRRLHPLFPGVLVAVVAATAYSAATGYDGPQVGDVPAGWPPLARGLPWSQLPDLVVPGALIALAGFAEAAAIARSYAALDRTAWDPNREFVSQGVANAVAGAVGGFPVGGSFTRSALTRLAGGRTRLAGAVTGLVVLALSPAVGVLSALPRAVLAGSVVAAVASLLRLRPLVELRRYSRLQFLLALATFALTLALAPRVQIALLVGVGLAVAAHLRREFLINVPSWTEGDDLHLRPQGVLYFGSAPGLEARFTELLAASPRARRLVVHLDGLGRVDVSGALTLRALLDDARRAGLDAEVVDVPYQSRKIVGRVLGEG